MRPPILCAAGDSAVRVVVSVSAQPLRRGAPRARLLRARHSWLRCCRLRLARLCLMDCRHRRCVLKVLGHLSRSFDLLLCLLAILLAGLVLCSPEAARGRRRRGAARAAHHILRLRLPQGALIVEAREPPSQIAAVPE